MPELDEPLVSVRVPKVAHSYYAEPTIRVREDWDTKQTHVEAMLGIAPDSHTIIEYPVHVWSFGYWNRATTRKVLAVVKRRFLAECKAIGYTKDKFSKPLEISLY